METKNKKALLILLSAPSGAGKSSLCRRLIETLPNMTYSISCTTRTPRGEERDGEHYYFLSEKKFREHIENKAFLEHALVHGHWYGTLKQTVYNALARGHDLIMDIDVQGARQIRSSCHSLPNNNPIKKAFVDIFITVPSMDELRHRLRGRSTEPVDVIEQRMRNAKKEMKDQPRYMHTLINDDFEKAVDELTQLLDKERIDTRFQQFGKKD